MGCNASSDSKMKADFHENYKLGEKLGEGAFGCVYKAHLRDKMNPNFNSSYAAKILDKKAPGGPSVKSVRKDFKLEVDMLSKIGNCTNVVGLIDAFEDARFCYVLMPCCGPTVLEAFLEQDDVNENDLARVCYGMTQGVVHIHSVNMVHRDVKPQNFLISHQGARLGDKDCTIKLCDMGFAVDMPKNGKGLKELCGTPPFMAPEMLKEEQAYDQKVDVWALGVSFYLMLYGTFPYNPSKPDAEKMKQLIREGKTKPPYKATEGLQQPSTHACEFVRAILARNPVQRPLAAQVLAMPYMRDGMAEAQAPEVKSAEPESEIKEFFRKRSRMQSLGGNIAQAAANVKQLQAQRAISPQALAIFEEELRKLQEMTGFKRQQSNRTMTLPSNSSRSLAGSISLKELADEAVYATATSPKSPEAQPIIGSDDLPFERSSSLKSLEDRSGKRHSTHGGEYNPNDTIKVETEEGTLLSQLRSKATQPAPENFR
eukprot:gnl/MRDRNA2_/MRDRNA2_132217_c0_seq1.p1 gnl/MRDRNA2_/MRDRNA2_132217_c0~~gnl/MRDRNA2_/MRDRNA2_132217_c0_seq1.p1  ORF type:complete len:485 (-),score=104.20 gnl/MRDRNA2_/MRDRNA2_132217_c0_seq1:33-1487(-)